MDIEVFLQKEHRNSRRPFNWRSHFRPQKCGQIFYRHEDFSEEWEGLVLVYVFFSQTALYPV